MPYFKNHISVLSYFPTPLNPLKIANKIKLLKYCCVAHLILHFCVYLDYPVHAEPYRISSVSYIVFYSHEGFFLSSAVKLMGTTQMLSKAILIDTNYPNNRQLKKNIFSFSSVYSCDNCGLNSKTVQRFASPLALVDCFNMN